MFGEGSKMYCIVSSTPPPGIMSLMEFKYLLQNIMKYLPSSDHPWLPTDGLDQISANKRRIGRHTLGKMQQIASLNCEDQKCKVNAT